MLIICLTHMVNLLLGSQALVTAGQAIVQGNASFVLKSLSGEVECINP